MNYVSLPVINYQTLNEDQTLRALDCACRSWGAFVLAGHPLQKSANENLLNATRDFFCRPLDFKKQVSRTESNPCGYYDEELTKNIRDDKEIYDYSPAELAENDVPWPQDMHAFRQAVTQHYQACETIALALTAAICENLGTTLQAVRSHFQPRHTSFLRLNYYPASPVPEDEKPLGINPHTDSGVLTLLLQDAEAGLEVYRDGNWYRVPGGSMLVNIGDVVQVWSNDRYRAPLHRVATRTAVERISAPYFFNPAFESNYSPLASTVDSANPPAYHPINWGEFRSLRAAGDYADVGDEVQIAQYRRQA